MGLVDYRFAGGAEDRHVDPNCRDHGGQAGDNARGRLVSAARAAELYGAYTNPEV